MLSSRSYVQSRDCSLLRLWRGKGGTKKETDRGEPEAAIAAQVACIFSSATDGCGLARVTQSTSRQSTHHRRELWSLNATTNYHLATTACTGRSLQFGKGVREALLYEVKLALTIDSSPRNTGGSPFPWTGARRWPMCSHLPPACQAPTGAHGVVDP